MPFWSKKKLPSRPMTDSQKANNKKEPPASAEALAKSDAINTPTKILQKPPAGGADKTAIPPAQENINPDLAVSLHTAAINIQATARMNTTSLDDTNILLNPLGFQCSRLLGSGGMGSVFMATDTKLQRRVAIKVLLPRLSGNRQFTQLFLKEAETVAKFIHTNIVQIYAIHVVQDIYFIIMEYVEGTTLRDKIKREGVLPEAETLRIIDQVSQALSETHSRGIIHRDIKPQNILLTPDGIPKVADFGLAVSVQETRESNVASAGTPTYMAPEQARGDTPTPSSDIYSLGVVMYMMLTGKIPYRANSVKDVLKEIKAGNRVDISEISPGINPTIAKIVRRAMEPLPKGRYLTMKHFNSAIRDAWLSYQKAGLRPMLPRVKRLAWAYMAPPVALVLGLMLGYLVHNPVAEKTSTTFEQAFAPRVEHLKQALGRIMNTCDKTDPVRYKCAALLIAMDEALKEKNPDSLVKRISEAEFFLDWREMEPLLLRLNKAGLLTGEALTESGALWDAAQKEDRQAFYTHRTNLLKALKGN